jgi:hypothetical protein
MNQLKYTIIIQWSEEDNCYLVGFPDFIDSKMAKAIPMKRLFA